MLNFRDDLYITFRLRQFKKNVLLVLVDIEHHGEKILALQCVHEGRSLHLLGVLLLLRLLDLQLLPLFLAQNFENLALVLLTVNLSHPLVNHFELVVHQFRKKSGHVAIEFFILGYWVSFQAQSAKLR